jgi:CRP-like cAMP-binding protein
MRQANKLAAEDLLEKLSPGLQRELLLELLRSSVLQFPLFSNAPRAFLAEIAQAHSWVRSLPGDVVVEEGELTQEIVFVVDGELMLQEDGIGDDDEAAVRFGPGSWFGEDCLIDHSIVRADTIVAVKESEMAVLQCSDFKKIIKKYPKIKQKYKSMADQWATGKLRNSCLRYSPQCVNENSASRSFWRWFGRNVQISPATPSTLLS